MSYKSKTQNSSHLSEYDTLNTTTVTQSPYNKNAPLSPNLTPSMKNLKLDSPVSPASNSPVSPVNNINNINVPVAPVNSNYSTFNSAYNAINNSMEVDVNEQVSYIILFINVFF